MRTNDTGVMIVAYVGTDGVSQSFIRPFRTQILIEQELDRLCGSGGVPDGGYHVEGCCPDTIDWPERSPVKPAWVNPAAKVL